ncbi:Mce family protein [Nocardia nepalensis]|uniref:Mce family protein n=1 Tax=Nocardia nepalensis TaxID=3375448 RepID=UPI003B67B9FD
MEQDFLRGSDRTQQRAVTLAAVASIVMLTAALALGIGIHRHTQNNGKLLLDIDTPYVAPGIASGTHVILHGVPVGEVTGLDRVETGAVRVRVALHPDRVHGLTDSFDIDFRPENYFGVTAINITGDAAAGRPLTAGRILPKQPLGDFSMSTMLEKGSFVVSGTLTDDMVATLDQVIKYTNGLNPMIQTGIVVADRVARTQQALPSTSLGYVDDILQVLPSFNREAVPGLYGVFDTLYNRRADGALGVNDKRFADADVALNLVSGNLFGAAGHLLASHAAELPAVTDAVQALTDAIPAVLANGALTPRFKQLVAQCDQAFSGGDGARTLNLRLVLDSLPGIAAPLGMAPSAAGGNR